jgi:hypothetical protein
VPCRDGAIAKILYLAELFLSLLYFSGRYSVADTAAPVAIRAIPVADGAVSVAIKVVTIDEAAVPAAGSHTCR